MKTIFTLFISLGFAIAAYSQTNFVKYVGNPILPLGERGTWDHTIAALASIIIDDTTYHMWYSGNPNSSYSPQAGYATSSDGINWKKYENNPILSYGKSGEFDFKGLLKPNVIFDDGMYKMWYVGGDFNNYFDTKIGYATSQDGISWNKSESNPILKRGAGSEWDNQTVTSPFVLRSDSIYQMWYMGRDNSSQWREGYATSVDGVEWKKHPGNPVFSAGSSGSWDAFNAVATCILYDEGIYYMFYHAQKSNNSGSFRNFDMGLATSTDGINWTRYAGNPILSRGDLEWDGTCTWMPYVRKDGHRWRMWYTGRNQNIIDQLGYAEDFSNAAHVDSVWAFVSSLEDSVIISATIANPHGEDISVLSVVENIDNNKVDTINLTQVEDTVWQGTIHDPSIGKYLFSAELINHSAGYVHKSADWGVSNEFIITSSENIQTSSSKYISQNHPNPFSSATTISYELPVSGMVKISVFDLFGRELEVLANAKQQTGSYQVLWDASGLPTGIYFYQLSINGQSVETRKMILNP